jgi:hypothetical protein
MRSQQSLSEGSWVNGSIITLWPRVSEQAKKMLCPWMVQGRCSEVVAPSVAQNEHDYIYISFHKEPMSKIHNSGDIGHISQCVSDQDLAGHKLHPFLSTSIFHGIMYLIRYTYIYTQYYHIQIIQYGFSFETLRQATESLPQEHCQCSSPPAAGTTGDWTGTCLGNLQRCRKVSKCVQKLQDKVT